MLLVKSGMRSASWLDQARPTLQLLEEEPELELEAVVETALEEEVVAEAFFVVVAALVVAAALVVVAAAAEVETAEVAAACWTAEETPDDFAAQRLDGLRLRATVSASSPWRLASLCWLPNDLAMRWWASPADAETKTAREEIARSERRRAI